MRTTTSSELRESSTNLPDESELWEATNLALGEEDCVAPALTSLYQLTFS